MDLANRLRYDWFLAGQLEDKEAIRPALNKCIKDLKDNGPAYLVELSKCNCCKRHQTDRPCNINELKKYEWNGGSGIEKHRNMILMKFCRCPCRHYCRTIVKDIKGSQ